MLKLQQVKKYYAGQKAVDDVSFDVRQGSIFGLLGPNGAGKSSILRMITGITQPDSGEIYIENQKINALSQSESIGYMPEERGLYKKMKIGEQAMYLAQLKGLTRLQASQQIKLWFEKLDMMSWWNKKVEDLSKGMSQKLQFVTTVIHQPKLLILDEPFSGLDPVNSEVIKKEIFQLSKSGTTVLFSTHRMEQVEEICEDIVLINKGKVLINGQVDQIRKEFKKNQYKYKVSGNLDVFGEKIIDKSDQGITLQLQHQQEAQEILKYCLDHQMDVYGFEEILPGLNEIFIQAVEGNAARTFEKEINI
jgi:ABC-2 type transport system ATP-binding protein